MTQMMKIETSMFKAPRYRFNPPPFGQPLRYSQNPNSTYFKIKIDLPCFNGHRHIKDILDWVA